MKIVAISVMHKMNIWWKLLSNVGIEALPNVIGSNNKIVARGEQSPDSNSKLISVL